tara:strand:- start:8567 stop:8920 length:354 start_codon:yes stop_codon:yes gene_type:complete
MPIITLTFTGVVQSSVQINDVAYYVTTSSLGGFDTGNSSNIVRIGPITDVGVNSITCDIDASTIPPATTDFIMFSKDNAANMSSLAGYYAKVRFINDDPNHHGELFSVSADYFTSSK